MSAEKIRTLNDAFRRTLAGGKTMMTAGIAALSAAMQAKVLNEVRRFDAFTAANDPHGEHDFGSFEVDGRKIFWKIDLYEEPGVKGTDGQPLTTRVLTIMLAEEW
jgi:Protein of unknown function (DUF3768)